MPSLEELNITNNFSSTLLKISFIYEKFTGCFINSLHKSKKGEKKMRVGETCIVCKKISTVTRDFLCHEKVSSSKS